MTAGLPATARSPFARDAGAAPFVWAHRGASALAPENSLEAFAAAVASGADGIELDVRLSADGVPVVIHEPALYFDGDGPSLHDPRPASAATRRLISQCRFDELRAQPLRHSGGRNAPLVRLEEVLAALPATMWINVEVKAGAYADAHLVDVLAACLRERPERTLFSSFDHVILRELHVSCPEIPVVALCDARLAEPRIVLASIPTTSLNISRALITHDDAVAFSEAGIAVSIYGRELLDDLDEVVRWPIVGVFLDDPRMIATTAGR